MKLSLPKSTLLILPLKSSGFANSYPPCIDSGRSVFKENKPYIFSCYSIYRTKISFPIDWLILMAYQSVFGYAILTESRSLYVHIYIFLSCFLRVRFFFTCSYRIWIIFTQIYFIHRWGPSVHHHFRSKWTWE